MDGWVDVSAEEEMRRIMCLVWLSDRGANLKFFLNFKLDHRDLQPTAVCSLGLQ